MQHTLDLLTQIAHGISTHFGTSCEIVIHDLQGESLESSIRHIENGHVSHRKIGDAPSGIVLETLEVIKRKKELPQDRLAYLTKTDDGRILKSSTIYIKNSEETQVNYILSLNYDVTPFLGINKALASLIETPKAIEESPKPITHNVTDLLDTLIEQSVERIGKPVALMTKDDKVTAIQFLNDAGAFLVTKSGDKISNVFGISKFTLYSYLDVAKSQD